MEVVGQTIFSTPFHSQLHRKEKHPVAEACKFYFCKNKTKQEKTTANTKNSRTYKYSNTRRIAYQILLFCCLFFFER